MTEFQVWKTIVDWVEDQGGTVFAACPPGSSVYDYKKFCIIDLESKKRDEPDILFSIAQKLYIIECKPTQKKCFSQGLKANSNESDVDKLHRIKTSWEKGHYIQQIINNYGIVPQNYQLCIGIGYAAAASMEYPDNEITYIEVLPDFTVNFIEGTGN